MGNNSVFSLKKFQNGPKNGSIWVDEALPLVRNKSLIILAKKKHIFCYFFGPVLPTASI